MFDPENKREPDYENPMLVMFEQLWHRAVRMAMAAQDDHKRQKISLAEMKQQSKQAMKIAEDAVILGRDIHDAGIASMFERLDRLSKLEEIVYAYVRKADHEHWMATSLEYRMKWLKAESEELARRIEQDRAAASQSQDLKAAA
jgi:hypothetical protein